MFEKNSGYNYSPLRIIIAELIDEDKCIDENNMKYIKSLSTMAHRDSHIEQLLEVNTTYVLFC